MKSWSSGGESADVIVFLTRVVWFSGTGDKIIFSAILAFEFMFAMHWA